MVLPKVRFKLPTVTDETNMLLALLTPKDTGLDYSRYVYHAHPILKRELEGLEETQFKDIIKRYVRFIRGKKYESMKGIINKHQREWNLINDKYMKVLEDVLKIKWPKKRLILSAYISINPISSESFDDLSFSIYYEKSLTEVKSLVAHEAFNFLFFMKWKKISKKSGVKYFEPLSIEWHLNEILATVIINNDPRIQKIIKIKEKPYTKHEKIKIGNVNAIEHFEKMYKRHLMSKTSSEKFLKAAYKEIKKYKKLFEGS